MGKSVTPKYCIVTRCNFSGDPLMIWDCKEYGRPNQANVDKLRAALNTSFLRGQTNYHLTEALGYIAHCQYLAVCLNDGRRVPLFESKMGSFETIG